MTQHPYVGSERRASRLAADEIDEIADRFMERITMAAENIGYDITSTESRAEINKDHQWVRSWRTGTGSTKVAAAGVAVTTLIGGVFWLIYHGLIQALSTGKTP